MSTLNVDSAVGTAQRLPEFSLAGKVIIVTGAAQGLGLEVTKAILEAGAIVYGLDLQPAPSPAFTSLATLATTTYKTTLTYHSINVTSQSALGSLITSIASQHSRLDGLLHAAGIQQETPALDYTAEDARRLLDVNVVGSLMAAQACAREMIKWECKGSIVLIASMSGTVANRGLICPVYNASKSAVLQLARNLASEWGMHGIRVNTISPGYIVTEMVEKLFVKFPEREKEWPTHNMLGRLSKPEEYRGATIFLLSDASSFMTGADLRMDGGHCAW